MTREEWQNLGPIYYEQCEKIRVNGTHGNKASDYTIANSTIFKEIEEKDLLNSAMLIYSFMEEHKGAEITIGYSLKAYGRHDYLESVTIRATTYSVIDKVKDITVKSYLRKIMSKRLGLPSGKSPDCKLVQLWQDGIIEWKDLVKAHKRDCEL